MTDRTERIIETIVEYRVQDPCKTAEEMEDICCEEWTPLTCCKQLGIIRNGLVDVDWWYGYSATELLDMYHPDMTEVEKLYFRLDIIPRQNPCGYGITEWDVSPGRCCEEVEDVIVDEESSSEILPAGGSAIVYADGGKQLYTWTTSSGETFFENGTRKEINSMGYVVVYATEDFCGSTNVIVDDGCSRDGAFLRSDIGSWVYYSNECMFKDAVDQSGEPLHQTGLSSLEYEKGVWKQADIVYRKDEVSVYLGNACDGGRVVHAEQLPAACSLGEGSIGRGDHCLVFDPDYDGIYDRDNLPTCEEDPLALGSMMCWGTDYATCIFGGPIEYRPSEYGTTLYKWEC